MIASRVALLCVALCNAGCSLLNDAVTKPAAEKPVGKGDGYLAQPSDPSALGPDERLLLAEYSDTQAAKLALETQLAAARATIDGMQAQLRQTEEVRDKERTGRAGSEAELTRLRSLLQDRETKILSLHIEKAKLTQDVLLLRIEATERRADTAAHASADLEGVATPLGGGR